MQPSGQYDKSFQGALLAHLLRTPELSRFLIEGASPRPEQEDFDTEPDRALLVAAHEVVGNIGLTDGGLTRVSLAHVLQTMVNAGHIDPVMAPLVVRRLAEVYRQELDPAYYLHHLPLFLREQRTLVAVHQGSVLAPEDLSEQLSRAVASSSLVGRRGRPASIDDRLPPPLDFIPTGFNSLDGPMGGGLARKKSCLVAAGTGIGKSSFALNIQRGAAQMGFRAGLWSLELPGEEVRQRRASLCAHYDYRTIMNASPHEPVNGLTLEAIEAQVREGMNEWTPAHIMARMLDFDYSAEEATVEKIDQDLTAEAEAGEPLDVMIIDWLECLEIPARRQGNNKRQQIEQFQFKELRHRVEHIAGKVTQLAVKHNVANWTFTQTNFEVQNKSVVRMKDKSEAKGASRKMSYFLGMGMSPEDEQRGIVTITADKTRNSSYFQCQLRRRLDQQRFEDLEAQGEISTP
jgi:KaiC/GvpD/RAD55 family RecA-like ATPase